MKKIFSAVLAASLIVTLASCSCHHEWKEADCVTPKTCTKCGAVEGESLGHEPGEPEVISYDLKKNMTKDLRICCSRCGEILEEKTEPMESLHENGRFLMNAEEFTKRFDQVFQEIGQDIWHAEMAESKGQAVCHIKQGDLLCGVILFGTDHDQILTKEQAKERNITGFACLCIPEVQGASQVDMIAGILRTVMPNLEKAEEKTYFDEISRQMQKNESQKFLLDLRDLQLESMPDAESGAVDFLLSIQ